jgi:hypothetical protein
MELRVRWGAALGIMAALVIGSPARAADAPKGADDAHALVKRMLDAVPSLPFIAKLALSSEGGLARSLELRHKRLGETDASYMEVTEPLDVKDTRFLFLDRIEGRDEQYIFLPALKRSVQVADEIRKQPFLGSEFYVSDLVRPELDAFTYSFVGDESVGGRSCKLVEVMPKTPANEIYSKARAAIDPVDLVVMRTEFFDPRGKLLKIWTIEKLEKVDGIWTPLEQKMTNVQEKRSSRLDLKDVRYRVELPDSMFTRTYLTR